jgi:hypothetical protein
MSRNFLVTAVAAVALVAFSASGFAGETTTVKGNSDRGHFTANADRMGGGGGHRKTAKVKSNKSNNNERMGGGGGRSVSSGRLQRNFWPRMGGGGAQAHRINSGVTAAEAASVGGLIILRLHCFKVGSHELL